jgi:hypothetical protein
MQKGLRTKNLKFFTGIENYEKRNSIPFDKFYSCTNARFSKKIVSSKLGNQKLGNALAGGTRWEGLYDYPYFNGSSTTEKLLGFYNKGFYEFNETTQVWGAIATAWPNVADAYTDGVPYGNTMYFVNPLIGAGNGVAKISNSTFSVISTTVGSPRGTAIETWLERLWIIGDPTSPNYVYASAPATSSGITNIEEFDTTKGATIFPVGKGGRLVGQKVINNVMYFFKDTGIYQLTAERFEAGLNPVELSRTAGAISQKSICVVENGVWFLTPQLEVRSLDNERNMGDNPRAKNLTEIIKTTMEGLDFTQSNAVMTYHNRMVKVQLKTQDSPTNNITIIFDYNTGGWSVDKGEAVNCACVWQGDLVFGEDSSGQVYTDDSGYTQDGAAFRFLADTPFMDDGRPDRNKRSRYIYFKGTQSYYQPITIRLYRNNYSVYSEYLIPSPYVRGVSVTAASNNGVWGSAQAGAAIWGGEKKDVVGIPVYEVEYLISIDQRSNMFALGMDAVIDNGMIECEQLILKIIDDNENYKRSDK